MRLPKTTAYLALIIKRAGRSAHLETCALHDVSQGIIKSSHDWVCYKRARAFPDYDTDVVSAEPGFSGLSDLP